MENQFLKAALWYQRQGCSVIPVKQNKKPYLMTWAEYQKKKPTEDSIKKWWETWPDANPAIVTGAISNLMVVDVDSEQGHEELNKLIPDSLITPTSRTPGGGWHYYFAYRNGLTNKARVITDCDIRTDGGYIISPPSKNEKGKYVWIEGLSIAELPPAAMPDLLYNNMHFSTRGGEQNNHNKTITNHNNHNISFELGTRDETLFHIANCLVKGGMEQDNILECLNIIGASCNPPFPEKEIRAKVESAFKRIENRKRNLTAEVREWITITWHNISITNALQNITNITNADRPKITVIMNRLVKEGILERVPNQYGVYRKVDTEVEAMDFMSAETKTVNIWLPFALNEKVEIMPGNIIVVAGSPDAGKTGLLLNIIRENMREHEIHYFNSEMGSSELKKRLSNFDDLTLDMWNFKAWERSDNFGDVIKPGPGKINIVDFLEMHENFYEVGGKLAEIHKKLKGAIAFVALQKNPGVKMGLGGFRSAEKPRLYLSMDSGALTIAKAKNWATSENPNGLQLNFKVVGGCKFIKTQGWHRPA